MKIFDNPDTFWIVNGDFSIPTDGILGSAFLIKNKAVIKFQTEELTIRNKIYAMLKNVLQKSRILNINCGESNMPFVTVPSVPVGCCILFLLFFHWYALPGFAFVTDRAPLPFAKLFTRSVALLASQ